MSGLEILGVVAAALQIAELGSRVSVKLCTLCHRTKHADTVINALSKEVALTCNVVRQLGANLKEDNDSHLYSSEACSTADMVLDECQRVFDEINEVIDLATKSHFRRIAFVLAEARRDSNLAILRSDLERMKTTMLLMLNVIIYAKQIRKQQEGEALIAQRELITTLAEENNANEERYNLLSKAEPQCDELQRYYCLVKTILLDIDAVQHHLNKERHRRIRNGMVHVHNAEKSALRLTYGDEVSLYFQDPFFDLVTIGSPDIITPSEALSHATTTYGRRMEGQSQRYTPAQINTTVQPSQSYILPPPPPRFPGYQQTKRQSETPPPPHGSPPVARYGPSKVAILSQMQQYQSINYGAGRETLRKGVLQPPQPSSRANYTPHTPFRPGVGIPGFDGDTVPTYKSQGDMPAGKKQQPPMNQPYAYNPADSAQKREDMVPVISGHVGLYNHDNDSHAPTLLPATSHHTQEEAQAYTAHLNESLSQRQNSNGVLPVDVSPREAEGFWPLEKVLFWLAVNGFSKDWQDTFHILELQGIEFLELGSAGTMGKWFDVIYPQLAKICETSGTGWNERGAREETKRMRRLIRRIQGSGNHEIENPVATRRQSGTPPVNAVESTLEPSPIQVHQAVPGNHGSGVMDIGPPGVSRSAQGSRRSFTVPLPGTYGYSSSRHIPGEGRGWPRTDAKHDALFGMGDYPGHSLSGDGSHIPPLSRAYQNSHESGGSAGEYASMSHQEPSLSPKDLTTKLSWLDSPSPATSRDHHGSYKQDKMHLSPQEAQARPPSGDNQSSYGSQGHRHRFLQFFKRKKGSSPFPSPDEQLSESPTSPVNIQQNDPTRLHERVDLGGNDMSLGERPSATSVSDHEQETRQSKFMYTEGKKWVFVTLNGLDYRLVDITSMDSVESLRAAICQNLGISDWSSVPIFLTEPGQLEHDEALNDTTLVHLRRMRADAVGSLKLFVHGSPLHRSTHYPLLDVAGLAVSIPEKVFTSSATAPQDDVPGTKPDKEVINQFANPSDMDELASQAQKHKRYIERKQRRSRKPNASPLYIDTGYRRGSVIDLDCSQISHGNETIELCDNPALRRKAPSTPSELLTVKKANSLRLECQGSPGSPGLEATLDSVGNMASATGEPPISDGDKEVVDTSPNVNIEEGPICAPKFEFDESIVHFRRSGTPQEDSDDGLDDGLVSTPLTKTQTTTTVIWSVVNDRVRQGTPRKPSLTVATESDLKKKLHDGFIVDPSHRPTPQTLLTEDPCSEPRPEYKSCAMDLQTKCKHSFTDKRSIGVTGLDSNTPTAFSDVQNTLRDTYLTADDLKGYLSRWTTLSADELGIAWL